MPARRTLFLLLCCRLVLPAMAQEAASSPAEAGVPFVLNVGPERYQAHGQNWAVAQDARGVMYFANSVGVVEYDGTSWRFIPLHGTEMRLVRALATGRDGTVYVGARGDFGYLAPDAVGQMRFVSLRQDSSFTEDVLTVHATAAGVFFQSQHRLVRWRDGAMRRWTPDAAAGTWTRAPGGGQFRRAFACGDTLYVQHSRAGLLRLDGDVLRPVPGGDAFATAAIYALLPWGDGRLLVGTREHGFFLLGGGTAVPFATQVDGFLHDHLLSAAAWLSDGTLALATLRGGVVVVDRQGVPRQWMNEARGLRNQNVKTVYVDAEGGLWLALNDGIARVEWPSPTAFFAAETGLKDTILSIHRHQGVLYVGTDRGLYRLEADAAPGARPRFREVPGIVTQCWSLASAGDALLAATTAGVFELRAGRVRRVRGGPALVLLPSRRFPGRVFAGLSDGLARLRLSGGRWTDDGTVDGLRGRIVRSVVEAPDGTLWLGGEYAGLVALRPVAGGDGYALRLLGADDGLPGAYARPLLLGGGLAVVTPDGLFRPAPVDGPRAFEPDAACGPALRDRLNELLNAEEDRRGNLWLSTWAGVGLARREGDGCAWEDQSLRRLQDYKVHAFFAEPTGTVWLGSNRGLVRFDPRASVPPPRPFPTLIRRVLAGRDSVVYAGGASDAALAALVLPYHSNTLHFEAAAPRFEASEELQFQFFLEGFDTEWWPWGREHTRSYTNLPPGTYHLRVRARTASGVTSPDAVLPFRIVPPWWRTPWAWAFYVAAGMAGVAGIVRARTAYLERRNHQLEARIAERTDELRRQTEQLEATNATLASANTRLQELDLLKSEFLSIAAHDLKNPLSGILGFSNILREELSDERTDLVAFRKDGVEFATLIYQTSQRLVHIVHDLLESSALDQGTLVLQRVETDVCTLTRSVVDSNRIQAEAKGLTLQFSNGHRCHAAVDDGRLREAIDNLVSNAIKFAPPRTAVSVSVYPGAGQTVCVAVRDQGPGLTGPEKERLFNRFQRLAARPTGGESSHGLGLYIVKKIAELHGGTVTVESAGRDQGSTFILEIPAN